MKTTNQAKVLLFSYGVILLCVITFFLTSCTKAEHPPIILPEEDLAEYVIEKRFSEMCEPFEVVEVHTTKTVIRDSRGDTISLWSNCYIIEYITD